MVPTMFSNVDSNEDGGFFSPGNNGADLADKIFPIDFAIVAAIKGERGIGADGEECRRPHPMAAGPLRKGQPL